MVFISSGVKARRTELDDIRAVFDDLARLPRHAFDAVGHPFGLIMKVPRQRVLVRMPSGDAQRRPRSKDSRADHISGVDRVAQGDVRIPSGVQIANCSEARQQGDAGILCADQRLSSDRPCQTRVGDHSDIKRQMCVAINQAGKHGHRLQINYFRALWDGDIRADGGNAFAFDQDENVVNHLTCAHVQRASGLDGDDFGMLNVGCDMRQANNK
jgi:hypothetical protein